MADAPHGYIDATSTTGESKRVVDPTADVVERLAAHRVLAGIPTRELEWLARHGRLVRYRAGELVLAKGSAVDEMFIQFSGSVVARVNLASGRGDSLETRGGEVTALLPFSRLGVVPGDTHAQEDTEAFGVHRDVFPEMIRECPVLIERLVHVMLDRSRRFASATLRDEQLQSLGRLAAGLAHELNNPASAAARSSKRLPEALRDASAAASAFGAARLSPEQRAAVAKMADACFAPPGAASSAIERAEREEEITNWLEARGVDVRFAEALAESSLSMDSLEELGASAGGAQLAVMVHTIAADFTVASLAREVEQAADRIHDLVSVVARFTQLDRAVASGPVDVAQGLSDTVAMLAPKARAKSVAVRLEIGADLPLAVASDDLNQVWLHLLDNAIDAVRPGGEVRVRTRVEHDELVVCIIDDGPGIPAAVASRIFDPFFTTKPPGQGSGIGLDIVRRVLAANDGHVAFRSEPGRTEFRVSIPVAAETVNVGR